ncbi:unnamed protein product [Arctogadus glacialis]
MLFVRSPLRSLVCAPCCTILCVGDGAWLSVSCNPASPTGLHLSRGTRISAAPPLLYTLPGRVSVEGFMVRQPEDSLGRSAAFQGIHGAAEGQRPLRQKPHLTYLNGLLWAHGPRGGRAPTVSGGIPQTLTFCYSLPSPYCICLVLDPPGLPPESLELISALPSDVTLEPIQPPHPTTTSSFFISSHPSVRSKALI